MIICNVSAITLAIIFLILIIFDRTCHTVPMMLVANSCLATLMFGSAMLSLTSFTLQNDLKQIQYQFPFCVFIGYATYVTCTIQNYSLLLQAIYRYLFIVHPNRLFWHSYRIQLMFICISWIIAIALPMEYLFTGEIIYDVDNQICQMTLRFSFSVIYMAFCLFGIPVSMIMFIYFLLVRYVKQMSANVRPTNTLPRAQRDLKMVRRIVILVMILVTICFPYQLFLIMSFFNITPKHNFRIAFIFGDTAMLCVIITLFQFTDPLKMSLMKIINRQANMVIPAVS
ncbi:unnamed protein product [Adineta steineri]|uniref:G-protein coupled receptors family 1 profile domain-containing protein n=3 Tax=Adineta steineri TaxID=433720 RepID=A0A815SRX7_9BILA|nr:unnamed protein product [Adineta steineri]